MLYYNGSLIIKILFSLAPAKFSNKHRKYKFLGAKKMRFYEPQRHNAAKNSLCPLRLCGSIRFIGFLKDAKCFTNVNMDEKEQDNAKQI
jgi:hypothetical protein